MKLKLLVPSLLLPFLVGALGSFFTTPQIPTWYATLTKPSWQPPNWLFGPVWSTLYLLMGVALYLVLVQQSWSKNRLALGVFGLQLLFNSLWSIVFFGLQAIGGAVVVIALLWILIVYNIILFYRIKKLAAYLLLPYLAWVSFASALNLTIWMLN